MNNQKLDKFNKKPDSPVSAKTKPSQSNNAEDSLEMDDNNSSKSKSILLSIDKQSL